MGPLDSRRDGRAIRRAAVGQTHGGANGLRFVASRRRHRRGDSSLEGSYVKVLLNERHTRPASPCGDAQMAAGKSCKS